MIDSGRGDAATREVERIFQRLAERAQVRR
jgi:hypothetical protein